MKHSLHNLVASIVMFKIPCKRFLACSSSPGHKVWASIAVFSTQGSLDEKYRFTLCKYSMIFCKPWWNYADIQKSFRLCMEWKNIHLGFESLSQLSPQLCLLHLSALNHPKSMLLGGLGQFHPPERIWLYFETLFSTGEYEVYKA